MRLLRILPVVWLVALLALPAGLWALGARQHGLENSEKTPYPAIELASLTERATFQQLDGAFLDRLPLREDALNVYGSVAIELFRESTDPRVALGRNGWLYFAPEWTLVCSADGLPLIHPGTAADSADVLARTLVASGRRTTVVFAGTKYLTHTKDAPSLPPAVARCASALDRAIQGRLRKTPGGLDLSPALAALEQAGKPVFLKNDTHWNWRGRGVFVRSILERIRPGLARAARIERGPEVEHAGDLAKILGVIRDVKDSALVARRRPANLPAAGEVLLLGDSQMEKSLLDPPGAPGVRPVRDVVLPGQPSCKWPEMSLARCDHQILHARTIIVESVTRDIRDFETHCWRPIALVSHPLRGTPGTWERLDGTPALAGEVLTIPASGSVSVRVHPADGDRARLPRLLRLAITHLPAGSAGARPAVTLTQQPSAGQPAPCATPSQDLEGGALFLPVPARRSTGELVITLTGPPGTRLARPQSILLDGSAARRVGP